VNTHLKELHQTYTKIEEIHEYGVMLGSHTSAQHIPEDLPGAHECRPNLALLFCELQ
jgi:hypothetical protein